MLQNLLTRVLIWALALTAFWVLWRSIQPPPVPPKTLEAMQGAARHYQRLQEGTGSPVAP